MRRLTLEIACIASLTTVLAACTGTSHSTVSKPTVSRSPLQSPTLTATPSASDMRAAQRAVIKLADVGSDFMQTPYVPTPQSERDEAIFNSCIGDPSATAHQTAIVYSMQFSKGDFEGILASITFVETDTQAHDDVVALQGSRGESCAKQSLLMQFKEQGKTASATIGPLVPSPTGTLFSANYRIRAQVPAGADVLPFVIDEAQAIKGRAEISVQFQNINQPVPASLERRAMAAILERL